MMQLWKNIKRQQKGDAKNKQINTQVTCVLNKWLLASESLKRDFFRIYEKKNLRVTILNTKKQRSACYRFFNQGLSLNICLSRPVSQNLLIRAYLLTFAYQGLSLKICLSGPVS
jgi:hypothetical protein